MKETLELRVNYNYSNLLFRADEGKTIGTSVRIIEISKDDPRYNLIPQISKEIKDQFQTSFFFGWKVKRFYTKNELEGAKLFRIKIIVAFEPCGEECGTIYDESVSCEICGSNRKQIGFLKLKKGSIPPLSVVLQSELRIFDEFRVYDSVHPQNIFPYASHHGQSK